MKISLIGPAYPFRGGIAHHTALLYRALKQKYQVQFISFCRQYPVFLYPGRSDSDPSRESIPSDGVLRIIDSVNPLSWFKAAAMTKKYSPELLILPWWTFFWTPQFLTIIAYIRFTSDIPVMFICHNVTEHESGFFRRFCSKLVLRRGDLFITHSDEEQERLEAIMKRGAMIKKLPHPVYDVFTSPGIDREASRKELKLSGKTLLFFGFVRPYKGLMTAIKAMPKIISRFPDTVLVIAGEFWQDKRKYVEAIEKLGIANHIRIADNYIPNEDVGKYFTASDLVLLPYSSATGSGIAQTAYAFDIPVIATNTGSLAETVIEGKTGYVVEKENPEAFADAVIKFFEQEKTEEFKKNIAVEKKKYTWESYVDALVDFTGGA